MAMNETELTIDDLQRQLSALENNAVQERYRNTLLRQKNEELQRKFDEFDREIREKVRITRGKVLEVADKLNNVVPSLKQEIESSQQEINEIRSSLDEWKVDQRFPRASKFDVAVANGDTLVRGTDDGFDIFVTSSTSTSLIRKATNRGRFSDITSLDVIPGTTNVIYTSKEEPLKVTVFDVLRSQTVFEIATPEPVSALLSSRSMFIAYSESGQNRLYRFTNDAVELVAEINDDDMIPIRSPDEIYAYRTESNPSAFHLKNAFTGQILCTIDAGFEYSDARLACTLVAVHRTDGPFKLFETSSPREVFACETEGYGNLVLNPISDCARFVAFTGDDHALTILTLNVLPDGARSLAFSNSFGDDDVKEGGFLFSTTFRRIADAHYVQYVTDSGVLKLRKLNEIDQSWDVVE